MKNSNILLTEESLREKIIGCWLGKSAGGTLGGPFEGRDGPFDFTYYDPVPECMMPNDDLDLQVVWACVLNDMDIPVVSRHVLGQAWLKHIGFPFDEYGVAIRNLKLGIKPPMTGEYDNWFINGMGAAIRTELWACLAPGNPVLAAKYAYEDACVDHAEDGLWASVFLAALESLAFIESDTDILLDSALAQLPQDSLVYQAVRDTRVWWIEEPDWRVVRSKILEQYGHENFTDVTMNMAFTVLGWLASEGDLGKGICIAANCGKDTDCTAATVGALMGIINPSDIDEKWLTPIGRELVLSPEIINIFPPATLDGFTDMILDLRKRINEKEPDVVTDESQTTDAYCLPVDITFSDMQLPLTDDMKCEILVFPENYESIKLPGAVASMDTSEFKDNSLLLRYRLNMETTDNIRLLFGTKQASAVWVDGVWRFGRDADGRVTPSPHRKMQMEGQYTDIILDKGLHDVVVAVSRPHIEDRAEWIIIAAETKEFQWIPGAFMMAV